MPHAIYLHSGLYLGRAYPPTVTTRNAPWCVSQNWEALIALAIAGLVNMAMVMMASGAFHVGHPDVAEIETAYHTLAPLLGIGAAGVFLLSTHRLGHIELGGGHDGRAVDHAGLRRLSHSDLAAPGYNDGAGLRGRCLWCERHASAGGEPGSALNRAAAANDRAAHVHSAPGYHG